MNAGQNKILPSYVVRKLVEDEHVKSFNCGDADLNDFLLREASAYHKALLAVTYVYETECDKKVIAYFSLANDRISLTDFRDKSAFNRFRKHRFINEKRLKSYPAAKICRLAVCNELQKQHIGERIINFIKSYFQVNSRIGCRFLTVDAYSGAVPFYLKNGFIPLGKEEKESPTRLMFFDLASLKPQTE